MSESIEVVRVPEGETGLASRLSEDQVQEIASLYVDMARDAPLTGEQERTLAKAAHVTLFTMRRALKSRRVMNAIKMETQAMATLALPRLVRSAEQDALLGDPRVRAGARDFVAKQAAGDPALVQINQNTVWDPSMDEQLWERGKEFFKNVAEDVADKVADKMLGDGK